MNDRVCILVLQRGFVLVGRVSQEGHRTIVTDGRFIRRWGTTKGLGEIAPGPTSTTQLDLAGPRVSLHPLQILFEIECDAAGWAKHLGSPETSDAGKRSRAR